MIRPIIRDLIKNRFYSKEHISNLPIVSIPPYSNLVSNGDFSNGTTGWIIQYSSTTMSQGTIRITGDGTNAFTQFVQDAPWKVIGHKILMQIKWRVTEPCNYLTIEMDGGTNLTRNNPTVNEWYTEIKADTLASNYSYTIVRCVYSDNATANGKSFEVDSIQILDLTLLAETITDLPTLSTKYPFNPNALGGNLQLCVKGVDGGSSANQTISIKDSLGSVIQTLTPLMQLNGVGSIKDELYLTDWKLPNVSEPIKAGTGTKKCNQYVLQASDITYDTSFSLGYSNVDYYTIDKPIDFIDYNESADGHFKIEGYNDTASAPWDSANNVGKITSSSTFTKIWVGFAKNTTLTQAQTALTGKKLTYVLATSQPINIDKSTYGLIGDLKYGQGGSIVQNAVVPCQIVMQYETPY